MARRCADIKRNRTTIEILIYRAISDWLLEVEDESGGSTVWTETFVSDTAALEEVMSVITAVRLNEGSNRRKPRQARISEC